MTSSNTSTSTHCHSIRYRHFTEEECNFMLANHGKMTLAEISKTMNRPQPSVRYWLDRRGLISKPAARPRWEEWQLEVLIKFFPTMHHDDIAVLVGKNPQAVATKAHKMHLLKDKAFRSHLHKEGARKRIEHGFEPFRGQHGQPKAVLVTDKAGFILYAFPMCKDCAKHFGILQLYVSRACHSVIHYTSRAKDYRFWFLKDYNKEHKTNIKINDYPNC